MQYSSCLEGEMLFFLFCRDTTFYVVVAIFSFIMWKILFFYGDVIFTLGILLFDVTDATFFFCGDAILLLGYTCYISFL